VRFVSQPSRARRPARPWIAVLAAYALALQVLLSGVAVGQSMAAGSTSDAFVVCHGNGDDPAGDPNGSGKPPLERSPCMLCTLAKAACAVLPADQGVSRLDFSTVASVVPAHGGRLIEYESPTGQYQRGPPLGGIFAG
jgi:hypothetical protein